MMNTMMKLLNEILQMGVIWDSFVGNSYDFEDATDEETFSEITEDDESLDDCTEIIADNPEEEEDEYLPETETDEGLDDEYLPETETDDGSFDSGYELENCKRELQELKKAFKTEQTLQNNRFMMLQSFLNQLVRGLYNQDTQQKTIEELSNMLHMCPYSSYTMSQKVNTSVHRNHPTTRQGDDCERRIAKIENVLCMGRHSMCENRIDKIEEKLKTQCEPVRHVVPEKKEMTYDKAKRLGLNRQLYGV
jgi:hypothetical protein